MAQYIEPYGTFSATAPTIFVWPLVRAQHLDADDCDVHFGPESHLDTHANHRGRWHPDEAA